MSTYFVQSWYYWEFIIYFEKILIMVMITYMNDYNEGIQICIIFLALGACQVLHINNRPYYTDTLNRLQSLTLLVCSMFYAARLMVRTFSLHVELDPASSIVGIVNSESVSTELVDIRRIETANNSDVYIYIVCWAWIVLFVFVMLYFIWTIYVHLMLFILRADQIKAFNILICGRIDDKTFMEKYST